MLKSVCAVIVACVSLITGGCAELQTDMIIKRGRLGDGFYLVTVTITSNIETHARCGNERALACTRGFQVIYNGAPITLIYQTVLYKSSIPIEAYILAAHEECHSQAIGQHLMTDPCHNEDHGIIER